MRYDAVVFDSDGVLVEPTAPDTYRSAIRRALVEHGVEEAPAELVEELRSVTPDGLQSTCAALGIDDVAAFWSARDRYGAAVQREAIRHGEKALYDDVEAVLDLPVPRAVVSNNQQATVSYLLEHYGLTDRFDPIIGRSPSLQDVSRKKPAPVFVEQAIEAVDADRPLFVGDSNVDLAAAAAAGIDAAFVRRPHRFDYDLEYRPAHEVDDLRAIRKLVLDGTTTVGSDD